VPQFDLASALLARSVAPAARTDGASPVARVMPRITVDHEDLYLSIADMFAIQTHRLGGYVGNSMKEWYVIARAPDFLLTGTP
jgi:hypothetical protein